MNHEDQESPAFKYYPITNQLRCACPATPDKAAAMLPIVTEVLIQCKKVRSLAKKALASVRRNVFSDMKKQRSSYCPLRRWNRNLPYPGNRLASKILHLQPPSCPTIAYWWALHHWSLYHIFLMLKDHLPRWWKFCRASQGHWFKMRFGEYLELQKNKKWKVKLSGLPDTQTWILSWEYLSLSCTCFNLLLKDEYIDYGALKELINACAEDSGSGSFSPRTTSLTVQRYKTNKDSAEERFFTLLEAQVCVMLD